VSVEVFSDERFGIVKEFLVESYENLDRLDRDLIALEKDPGNPEILASVFRTIHTIKGTSGFLAFHQLGAVTHVGENLLARLRDGLLTLNAEITTACWPWWMRCGRCWEASKRRASRGNATIRN